MTMKSKKQRTDENSKHVAKERTRPSRRTGNAMRRAAPRSPGSAEAPGVRSASSRAEPPTIVIASEKALYDFVDDTKKWKGKRVTASLYLAEFAPDTRLRDLTSDGATVRFDVELAPQPASVAVSIPEGMSVPNAGYLDLLDVSFHCTKGRLDAGNLALRIVRSGRVGPGLDAISRT